MSTRSSARRHRGTNRMVPLRPRPAVVTKSALRPNVDPYDAITWWQQRIEKPLFVYFIQDGGGSVKIGKAFNPVGRLAELQCGNPRPLSLRHVVLAAEHTEAALHAAWRHARGLGEWFGGGYGGGAQAEIIQRAQEAQSKQIKASKQGTPDHEIALMVLDIVISV